MLLVLKKENLYGIMSLIVQNEFRYDEYIQDTKNYQGKDIVMGSCYDKISKNTKVVFYYST